MKPLWTLRIEHYDEINKEYSFIETIARRVYNYFDDNCLSSDIFQILLINDKGKVELSKKF